MPHLTLIYPCVGRFPHTRYIKSWQMQPLSIAVLASLTPADWNKSFFDDRFEDIDFDHPTDLVAISVETFTARRGYQIAAEFRARGVPVVMGGYHATFRPEEVLENADAVCVGEAEGIWSKILDDTEQGKLKGVYNGHSSDMNGTSPDRSIFKDKKYLDVALIETGRGCRFNCTFCSITSFHKGDYCSRSVDEIVTEVKGIRERLIFIVDDNIISDPIVSEELFRGLKPLGIKWVGQATANIYRNTHLMDLMAESGCIGLLVGFESLDSDNLDLVEKDVNQIDHYSMAVRALRDRGIIVYGTFMFGFPNDSDALFERTVRFAKDTRLFLAAFNHMIPFPGTPFYDDLAKRGHLTHDRWWLSEDYR